MLNKATTADGSKQKVKPKQMKPRQAAKSGKATNNVKRSQPISRRQKVTVEGKNADSRQAKAEMESVEHKSGKRVKMQKALQSNANTNV